MKEFYMLGERKFSLTIWFLKGKMEKILYIYKGRAFRKKKYGGGEMFNKKLICGKPTDTLLKFKFPRFQAKYSHMQCMHTGSLFCCCL